jgi:hypothetical protein
MNAQGENNAYVLGLVAAGNKALADKVDLSAAAAERAAGRYQTLNNKLDGFFGTLDRADALDSTLDAFDNIGKSATEAWDATKKGADDAELKQRAFEKAIRDTQRSVAELEDSDILTHPQAVKIQTLLDQGKYDEARDLVAELTKPEIKYVSTVVNPGTAGGAGVLSAGPRRASGGPVAGGEPYIVGENGPELVVPSSSSTVVPASQTARMLGGGREVTLNVHLGGEFLQSFKIALDKVDRGSR